MIGRSVKCKLRLGNQRQVFTVKKAIEWGTLHKYHMIGYAGDILPTCMCSMESCRKTRLFIKRGRMHWDPIAYSFKLGPKPVSVPPTPVAVVTQPVALALVENVGDTPVVITV